MSYATIYRTRPPYTNSYATQTRPTLTDHPVNVVEGNNFFRLELAAPGRSREDFKLEIENNKLRIKVNGEETETNGYRFREFKKAPFEKQFTLSQKIDTGAIQANYENGVLLITLPVKAPKVVEIK
jgi:HSP20 family protein